jgi:CRP-like cAMP-binding protein
VAGLRRLDRSVGVRDRDIALLQAVAMFRALPLPSIEQLARRVEEITVAARHVVFHQGDIGDRYYVIESGVAEVVGDGRVVAVLGQGDGFGEIALFRRVRRTATVRAANELRLQSLRSEHFLPIVLGHTPSRARRNGR